MLKSDFQTWFSEISGELAAAHDNLAAAAAVLATAEDAARAARLEKTTLADAFGKLDSRTRLATALTDRRTEREAQIRKIEAAPIGERAVVKICHGRILDLETALAQITSS